MLIIHAERLIMVIVILRMGRASKSAWWSRRASPFLELPLEVPASCSRYTVIRDLGVWDSAPEDLSFGEAEEWTAELRAMREDVGRIGRE